jgi:hypothetical protein
MDRIETCWRCGTLTTVIDNRCRRCNLDMTPEDEDIIDPMANFIKMPKHLTAENGAKSLLCGEFSETIEVNIEIDDPDSDGIDTVLQEVTISWTNIKKIYSKAVEYLGISIDKSSDADEPITQNWVFANFPSEGVQYSSRKRQDAPYLVWVNRMEHFKLYDNPVPHLKTRGDVRNLMHAMGFKGSLNQKPNRCHACGESLKPYYDR